MSNKYEKAYEKAYKGLKSESKDISSRAKDYGSYMGELGALPYQLKEEFRERRDPALSQKINQAEQLSLGGAIEGLNKYQNITNPFARRALAESYQGGLQRDVENLYDERERREGTLLEYIDKWTGLFGAEAKKEEIVLNAMQEDWQRRYGVAGQEYGAASTGIAADEAQSQWEKEFQLSLDKFAWDKAQAGRSGSSSATSKYQSALEDMRNEVYEGRYTREQAKDILQENFPDKNPNDIYDYVPDKFEKSPQFWGQQEKSDTKYQWQVEDLESDATAKEIQRLREKDYSDDKILEKMRGTSYYPYAKKLLE